MTKKIILASLAVFMLLLTACNSDPDLEVMRASIQQRVLDLEAKGVSITTTPVSIFSAHDFYAVPVGLTIHLDVDRDMIFASEWGITEESDVELIVGTFSELFDYFYERRIPLSGIRGIDSFGTEFPGFFGVLASRGLSVTFSDMFDNLRRDHPVQITSAEARYNVLRKTESFLDEGNMLWLEDFGIEVTVRISGEPPFFSWVGPLFSVIPDVPFGITCQESLELFMDAAMHLTVMNLGWVELDYTIRHNLGLHHGLDGRTLLELYAEGMRERFREVYGY